MDAFEQFQSDFQEGRLDLPRLFSFLFDCLQQLQQTQQQLQQTQQQLQQTQQQLQVSQAQLQETQQQLKTAQNRIAELEKKLGGPPTPRIDQPYSLRAEEKRQQAKDGKKKNKSKGGRRRQDDTTHLVARTEPVYPEGVPLEQCRLSHVRQVWRLENGRSVLVAYEVYRGPKNLYGKIPGVVGRCGFGWEIIIAVAHLAYDLGISLDKACSILDFFQELPIRKSQAEALLKQMAKHCEHQFDVLCVLIANSAIVHADETSWSLKSVWAFLSEQARVLLFGVNKDAQTLKRILDADVFQGILFSDDAAVYSRFTQMQKCWAHLIRKAIKLTLQDGEDQRYRLLADGLLKIYRDARAIQTDAKLDDAGKLARVAALEAELAELCYGKVLPDASRGLEHDYVLLAHEVMRLKDDCALFTFVSAPTPVQPNGETMPVGGTNNEAERTLRGPAEARKTGRTNKTPAGTRRRTIVTSVLQSLRLYLPKYTLKTAIAETLRWLQTGLSCFEEQLQKLKLNLPQESILQQLYPTPQPQPQPSG
jgi:transposase